MLRNSLWLALAAVIALACAARAQSPTMWTGSLQSPIAAAPPSCGAGKFDFTVPCNAVFSAF